MSEAIDKVLYSSCCRAPIEIVVVDSVESTFCSVCHLKCEVTSEPPDLPDKIKYAVDPYIPHGRSKIANSQYFDEIIEKMLAGWTDKSISTYVFEKHNEFHSPPSLYAYRKAYINPMYVLPPETLTKVRATLRKFEGALSAREGIRALMLAQEMRVSEMIEQEQKNRVEGYKVGTNQKPANPNYFNSRLFKEIELLYTMYRDEVNLEVALGSIKGEDGKKVEPPVFQGHIPGSMNIDQRRIVYLQKIINFANPDKGADSLKEIVKSEDGLPPAPPEFLEYKEGEVVEEVSKEKPEDKVEEEDEILD